jgi:hypothetical protein
MTVKEDVDKMMTQFGLASKAGIRADIDELCKATDIPFTGIGATVAALKAITKFAGDIVPKICKELGVDASGKLAADVTMLGKTCSVEATKFPLAVKELADSMQIQYADIYTVMQQVPMLLNAANAPKKVEAPCVCAKGVEQCRDCKAKEHPCVCKSVLLSALDQPMHLCKAKVHECVCTARVNLQYSSDPGNGASFINTYGGGTWAKNHVQGAPACCRQHAKDGDDDDVIDLANEEDVKPKKKKSRKSKG